jgi:hypothetical protein
MRVSYHVAILVSMLTDIVVALSTDQISSTVATVLAEYLKTSERTIFWDENMNANIDPFAGLPGGFFSADWDLKVRPYGIGSGAALLISMDSSKFCVS